MPLDYAIHAIGNKVQGDLPPAPQAVRLGGQKALAEDVTSGLIAVDRPAVLICVASAKLRIDIQRSDGVLDPANSPMVLLADERVFYALPIGSYQLRTTAFV